MKQKRTVAGFVFLAILVALARGVLPARAAASPACGHLADLMAAAPAGPVFLASYPTVESGPLHGAAFLYDDAVAAIALTACGQAAQARRIGDAMVIALDHDRYWHDGRLRNGYAAGSVGEGTVKLAGWWDNAQGRWLEDRYQVGSDSGNMAWAMLALLILDHGAPDGRYRAAAVRIGTWVAGWQDSRGAGGFTGGTFAHEPSPEVIRWKSTEHNTDLAAAFSRLADLTGDPVWRGRAAAARHFVETMWDPRKNCFVAGSGDDGQTVNPFLALDAQVWPLLALPGAAGQYGAILDTAERRLSVDGGFAYSEVRMGIWTEGTAQMALLQALLGHDAEARALTAAILAQRAPGGGFFASDRQSLPTGFMLPTDPTKPRVYYRLPHLGAAAWAALAERRFNPFTGTPALP